MSFFYMNEEKQISLQKFNFAQKIKKVLAIAEKLVYNDFCCGMIAVKREVAAQVAGVPWSECQVRKLTTSHCTHIRSAIGRNNV